MAETLGSLVDKLTIKSIREFYLQQGIASKQSKFSPKILRGKLAVLKKQKSLLTKEIEAFITLALRKKVTLREEKLKLYNRPRDIGNIGSNHSLSKAIDGLAQKNLQLWHLEDEARRRDVGLAHIGRVKREIDLANQQRNDFIDKIDELFEQKVKQSRRRDKKQRRTHMH